MKLMHRLINLSAPCLLIIFIGIFCSMLSADALAKEGNAGFYAGPLSAVVETVVEQIKPAAEENDDEYPEQRVQPLKTFSMKSNGEHLSGKDSPPADKKFPETAFS